MLLRDSLKEQNTTIYRLSKKSCLPYPLAPMYIRGEGLCCFEFDKMAGICAVFAFRK